jgi:hypothetical protein
MPREYSEPTFEGEGENQYETHPSYVVVGFSRVTGGDRRFFGSSVTSPSFIRLKVNPAKRQNRYGSDKVYATQVPLIEIDFSPAQFAEMITTMNVGTGTCGTMGLFNGKQIPQTVEKQVEAERAHTYLKDSVITKITSFRTQANNIRKILEEKATITKTDRRELAGLLETMMMEVERNMPFYFEQVHEGIQKMVSQAKSEVDAFVTAAVMHTGLEALRSNFPKLGMGGDVPEIEKDKE